MNLKQIQNFRNRVRRHPFVDKVLLNPWITTGGLLLLLLQVFFGTLYQTDHGLYESQRKFFGFGVMLGDVVPLPGALSVLWVLSIQLLTTVLFVLPLKAAKTGLWILHLCLLGLLFGGFLTHTRAVESHLTLSEGSTGYYTVSYHDYELAFWQRTGDTNQVVAIIDSRLKPGRTLSVEDFGVEIEVRKYFRNSRAFSAEAAPRSPYLSASGIGLLEPVPPAKEAERNVPGILFRLTDLENKEHDVLLYGGEIQPLRLRIGGEDVLLQLRPRHYPLGYSMKLLDFRREVHPNTETPAKFESDVELLDGPVKRQVKIWMNNPLRYAGATFFQASFSQPANGPEQSTLAVVTNPGRNLPYIFSIAIFAAMLLHFSISLTGFLRRRRQTHA